MELGGFTLDEELAFAVLDTAEEVTLGATLGLEGTALGDEAAFAVLLKTAEAPALELGGVALESEPA